MQRSLNTYEIGEAQLVFGDSMAYGRVTIHEQVAWPNWIGHFGSWISRTEMRGNNAVTLGNEIYFPVRLRTTEQKPATDLLGDMSWLVHELAHVWQYQQFGTGYLLRLVRSLLQFRSRRYHYGAAKGLRDKFAEGVQLGMFTVEQQGEIARHYYTRLKRGQDVSAWLPFIDSFQSGNTNSLT